MDDFNLFGSPTRGKGSKRVVDPLQGILSGTRGKNSRGKESSKYERVPVAQSQKNKVLLRQKGRCAHPGCTVVFHADNVLPHFDHIKRVDAGGKSLVDNLQALCPNHHDAKTREENLKKIEKRRQKPKQKSEKDPLRGIFAPPKRGKGNFPF